MDAAVALALAAVPASVPQSSGPYLLDYSTLDLDEPEPAWPN